MKMLHGLFRGVVAILIRGRTGVRRTTKLAQEKCEVIEKTSQEASEMRCQTVLFDVLYVVWPQPQRIRGEEGGGIAVEAESSEALSSKVHKSFNQLFIFLCIIFF